MNPSRRQAVHGAVCVTAAGRSVVLGAGQTGLSVARFLRRRGEALAVADTREHPPGEAELQHLRVPLLYSPEGFRETLLRRADRLIVSPGIAPAAVPAEEARRRGIPVIGDLSLFAAAADAPIVAVTGTNGKSTVTALTAHLLAATGRRVRAGGNLGPPALDLLTGGAVDCYVLEVSSFQLEYAACLPLQAGAVLNVTDDHLDRHGSLAAYAAVKARLLAHAALAVINRQDAAVRAMAAPGRVVSFGLDAPQPDQFGLRRAGERVWLCRGERRIVPADELPLAGRHNAANVLAALALAHGFGGDLDVLGRACRSFTPLPHRCEVVSRRAGVVWVDDSKGTNVAASAAAVAGFEGPLLLIAGGLAKGQDFHRLAEAMKGKVRRVLLIGRDADRLASELAGAAPQERCATLAEAVRRAHAISRPGDTVLLSPACASQDMFRDYRDRGEQFRAALEELH